MALVPFTLLYDYRCPFARNVHEHVLSALDAGLDLDVTFEPWTLSQGHLEPGAPAVWDDPAHDASLLALEVSVAVRDVAPEHFQAVHGALFDARHVQGVALTSRAQIDPILIAHGVDLDVIDAELATGRPRKVIATNWTHYHDDLDVFGVPTFVVDDADATFVRLMHGPDPDNPAASKEVITRLLDLIVSHEEINELKHTRLSR